MRWRNAGSSSTLTLASQAALSLATSLLLFERVLLDLPSVEDQRHGFDGEVAALDEPLVILFGRGRRRAGTRNV
jgi:hypothetical protein